MVENAVPKHVQQLLQVFELRLKTVEFPGVSHAVLAQLAIELERVREEVDEAVTRLNAARASQEACEHALQERAVQALRYAQVFAEGNAELKAELDAIRFPQPNARDAPRTRRARTRKAKPSDGRELFEQAPVAAE